MEVRVVQILLYGKAVSLRSLCGSLLLFSACDTCPPTTLRRFFAKNLLFIILLNALVKPVWIFAIDRTVQNRVGHAAYGTFQALLKPGATGAAGRLG